MKASADALPALCEWMSWDREIAVARLWFSVSSSWGVYGLRKRVKKQVGLKDAENALIALSDMQSNKRRSVLLHGVVGRAQLAPEWLEAQCTPALEAASEELQRQLLRDAASAEAERS